MPARTSRAATACPGEAAYPLLNGLQPPFAPLTHEPTPEDDDMIGILHTTESDAGSAQAVARYLRSKGSESHTVYDPATDEEIVLIPASRGARALRNEPGGVETNNRERDGRPGPDVYQIEIVGRAADIPLYSNTWYERLRTYLLRKGREWGVPFEFPLPFEGVEIAYGVNSPNRLSHSAWYDPKLAGWIGHQHVPENSHWDPGKLDLSRLIHTGTKEPEMELTDKTTNGWTVNDVLNWTKEDTSTLVSSVRRIEGLLAANAPDVVDLSSVPTKDLVAELSRRV